MPGPKTAAAKAWLGEVARKVAPVSRMVKQIVLNKQPIELAAEEATDSTLWGPHGALLAQLSEACYDGDNYKLVWRVFLRRVADSQRDPSLWRQTYKGLLLIEHLVKNSSSSVVTMIMEGQHVLEGLRQYSYKDERGKDQGVNVSNRAKELCVLLSHPQRIREERARAKAARAKYTGLGSGTAEGAPPAASAPAAAWQAPAGSRNPYPAGDSSYGESEAAGLAAAEQLAASQQARMAAALGQLGREEEEQDPVAATARRIHSLREQGELQEEGGSSGAPPTPTQAPTPQQGAAPAGLEVVLPIKPTLRALSEARSRAPKSLSSVKVNPVIAAALLLPGAPAAATPAPAPAAPLDAMPTLLPIAEAAQATPVSHPSPSQAPASKAAGSPQSSPKAAPCSAPASRAGSPLGSPTAAAPTTFCEMLDAPLLERAESPLGSAGSVVAASQPPSPLALQALVAAAGTTELSVVEGAPGSAPASQPASPQAPAAGEIGMLILMDSPPSSAPASQPASPQAASVPDSPSAVYEQAGEDGAPASPYANTAAQMLSASNPFATGPEWEPQPELHSEAVARETLADKLNGGSLTISLVATTGNHAPSTGTILVFGEAAAGAPGGEAVLLRNGSLPTALWPVYTQAGLEQEEAAPRRMRGGSTSTSSTPASPLLALGLGSTPASPTGNPFAAARAWPNPYSFEQSDSLL